MSLCVGFDEAKVHEMYPEASMVLPEKIWSAPSNKLDKVKELASSGNYLGSLKRDGYFYMLNRTPNYTYLFSRGKSTVTKFLSEKAANVPHLVEAAQALPPDTLLVGEIYVPGGKSKDVTRIMGCLPAKAVERQRVEGNIHYYINDIITLNGEDLRDLTFEERAATVSEVYNTYFMDSAYISLAEQLDSPDLYEIAIALIEAGEEGMVLRKKTAKYTSDKKPAWASIKIKAEDTVDVIITGLEEPTKEYSGKELDTWPYWIIEKESPTFGWSLYEKCPIGEKQAIRSPEFRTIAVTKPYYFGWKNSLEVSGYDNDGNLKVIGAIASGLTDEIRADLAANPENYLNRVVEVRCMSVDKAKKSIRHGFFKRFRDDKNPEECTFKEIFK